MKKLLLLLMIVSATWVGVTWGNVSAAAISPFKSSQPLSKQVIKFKFQGDNAYTDFYVTEGCISAYISVAAGESVVKDEPGKPATNSVATIQINGADSCTQRKFFGYGSANLSPDAFHLQSTLQSAKLNAVVQLCCDQNDASFPVDVNLTWTGTGAIGNTKYSYTSKSPSCRNSYSSEGSGRFAVVSGSVTFLGTTFSPDPGTFSYAVLGSSKQGSMTIGCN